MPEHSSWLTLILSHFRETLEHNSQIIGASIIAKREPGWHSFEPLVASLCGSVHGSIAPTKPSSPKIR